MHNAVCGNFILRNGGDFVIFVIGGAYQGKTEYVMNNYNLSAKDIVDGAALQSYECISASCINNFHLFVKAVIQNGKNPVEEAEKLIQAIEQKNDSKDIIIIMNEIGNGIIPLEKADRLWREETGKVGCFLAAKAEKVERICCGIPTRLK